MTSANHDAAEVLEPARKRQKLSPPDFTPTSLVQNDKVDNYMSQLLEMFETASDPQMNREIQTGIRCYVNDSNPGFSGILKQRYTDFLVNEVTLDGKVVHLTNIKPPRFKAHPQISKNAIEKPGEILAELGDSISLPTEAPEDPALPSAPPDGGVNSIAGVKRDESTPSDFTLNQDDLVLLDSYFGADIRESIVKLHKKVLQNPDAKPASLGSVSSQPITDRQLRTKLHKDMRRIFNSQLETVSDADGVIKVVAAQRKKPQGRHNDNASSANSTRHFQTKGKLGWQELGGEHLHFSLYKENKDTMEVISYISSRLKIAARQFSFAGTKDRRAVTVQRVSIHRVRAEHLFNLNKSLYGSKIGNFKYEKHRLELGDLLGNEFLITLRDCHFAGSYNMDEGEQLTFAHELVGAAIKNMQVHGFINYYGLQRFGTYAVGTDDIGKQILKGDFEGAVNDILMFSEDALAAALNPSFLGADGKPLPRDDIARAHGIHIFRTTGKAQAALDKIPRKFSGESTIIRQLSRNGRDFAGALLQIPRGLRLMYVHAYQSLVWNMAASERWTRFGGKVIEGDLVLVDPEAAKNVSNAQDNEVDENGEIVVLPAADDVAVSHDDLFQRARPLTAKEVASGKYSIFDIVLPTPGYDIEYPNNEIGDYYREFMTSERGGGLDPANMRRTQKDFSLSGSYRKLLGEIGSDVSYEIKLYSGDNEQLVETDLGEIMKIKSNAASRGQAVRSQAVRSPGMVVSNESFAARDIRAQQLAAWKNLPAKLAKDEKEAEASRAQESKKPFVPNAEPSQPTFKETFIQKSVEKGGRTGHRETTIILGTGDTSPNIQAEVKTANEDRTKEKHVQEVIAPPIAAAEAEVKTDTKNSVPAPVYNETEILMNEVKENETGSAPEVLDGPVDVENPEKSRPTKIAVIVKFQLGSSQYATMALRELMKRGGVQTYKPDYSSR